MRGKKKEERGKRKEEKGKRKAERGKRKEEAEKSSKFSEPSVNQTLRLEICKAFQDRLTFYNRHMIVWIGRDS